jgi:D-serine deaminase-like pyridoxal phosphate-dependent protein
MKLEEVETPALLVELDAMESNLNRMALFFDARSCKVRPHFKNHKAPLLARKQLDRGAIGMTCATLREAEILVQHGIKDVLIANEIVGDIKPARLAELSRDAHIVAAVDSPVAVRDLARARRNRKTEIHVVIDINVGLNRCGVPPGEPALYLARLAVEKGLSVRGIMGYDGQHQATPPSAERDRSVLAGSKALVDTARLFERAGIPIFIVSTGGTGTYSVSGDYPGITDIQAGSYLLMDTRYMNLCAPFQRSLTVFTSVISVRNGDHVVVDAGVKAISGERGLPTMKDDAGLELTALHAEHALIKVDTRAHCAVEVGQKLEMWVYYSDATVNLHSRMYGVRNGQVEEVLQIAH